MLSDAKKIVDFAYLILHRLPCLCYNVRMNTSLSIFAKALASENISFSFSKEAETASFDVKSRHLIMPMWDVTETVKTMLVAHEISHAMWTPYERSEELLKAAEADGYNAMLLMRIANIIEDVRIEKLMKQKFPGTRRDFFLGYKVIADLDLFGFKKMDLPKAGFLNRINIHFKFGIPGFIPMTFEGTEQEVVDMVDGVVNFDQVFEVAKYLYDHPSMKEVREKVESAAAKGDKQGDKDVEKIMGDKNEIPGDFKRKDGEYYQDAVITLTGVKDLSAHIVSTATILADYEGNSHTPLNLDDYRKFVRESDAFVRQLVAQFERKKAADEIRRERPKQTGMLNLDRLHQYRTHDDIFLSKIVKQEGKNHGIVFMLDFSGSMGCTIGHAYLQVLQLVWFCEKAKIPFEVFGYTDVYHTQIPGYQEAYNDWMQKNPNAYGYEFEREWYKGKNKRECPTGMEIGSARLLNIASSTDDAAKRERLCAFIYETYVSQSRSGSRYLNLNGTPTVECVALASQFMVEWVKANNIQIPTLMVVTDGCPNGINTRTQDSLYHFSSEQSSLTVTNEIVDTVHVVPAKYAKNGLPNAVIGSMLESLRSKLNARCVGMYVMPGRTITPRCFEQFCMSAEEQEKMADSLSYQGGDSVADSERYKAASEAYKEGCLVLHEDTFPGYDSYFLIQTPKPVKDEDAIVTTGNFTKVKNTFIKTMAKRAGSRVFLSRYVDIVAGQPIRKMDSGIYGLPCFPAGMKFRDRRDRKGR